MNKIDIKDRQSVNNNINVMNIAKLMHRGYYDLLKGLSNLAFLIFCTGQFFVVQAVLCAL